MAQLIQIHPLDSVAVALADLPGASSHVVGGKPLTLAQDIPFGHKVALRAIAAGEDILKYGLPIGHATQDIAAGAWVHTHNLRTNLSGQLEYTYQPLPPAPLSWPEQTAFMGYARPDGQTGIRNEVWIVPTVGCVNQTAQQLERMAAHRHPLGDNFDGVYCCTHPWGCSQMGEDQRNTQSILAGLCRHPNAAGVLVLGLGCENNHIEAFKPFLGDYDPARIRFLATQDVQDEYEAANALIDELVAYAKSCARTPCPVSALRVGLKCGGSDAFSGITANPLVGRFSDMLCAAGGTTVLSEVPEMFGAETLLMARARDSAVFADIVALINDFKAYFEAHDQVVYENPSPGNKKGGISTLEDKSLGCTQKAGAAPITGVLRYGERLRTPGVNLLYGPGNDLVSTTALTAAGCQMVLFTTGRGTPFGGMAPTLKIATNTPLYERKPNWCDYNAGRLLQGEVMDALARDFYAYVLRVAAGERSANERGGQRQISFFKDGVIL